MAETKNSDNRITLSNGVVFKFKEFPREQIARINQKIQDEYPEPQPPMVWIEDRGRDEPNENDVIYRSALASWRIRLTDRVMNALFFDALELVKKPEDMPGSDSPEFRDFLKLVHDEEPLSTEQGRYVQWVQYRAIPDKDMLQFQRRLLQLAGIPEEDVREIETTFQGDTGGKPDTGNGDLESSQNRD